MMKPLLDLTLDQAPVHPSSPPQAKAKIGTVIEAKSVKATIMLDPIAVAAFSRIQALGEADASKFEGKPS